MRLACPMRELKIFCPTKLARETFLPSVCHVFRNLIKSASGLSHHRKWCQCFCNRSSDKLNISAHETHCICWLSWKVQYHQWRALCQLSEAVTEGYHDQTFRRHHERNRVSSGWCFSTYTPPAHTCMHKALRKSYIHTDIFMLIHT